MNESCYHFLDPYIFVAPHDLLEKVNISGAQGWQVRLPIAEQEVVELLLRLHLGAQVVHVDLGVRHV